MEVVIYGIKNCDTMKKAFAWLGEHGIAYRFHDYRKDGVDTDTLRGWCARLGWQALVNTRGTTWRKLDPAQQAIADDAGAVALMQAHSSLIKRPVLTAGDGELLVGFDPERYAQTLVRSGAPQA